MKESHKKKGLSSSEPMHFFKEGPAFSFIICVNIDSLSCLECFHS